MKTGNSAEANDCEPRYDKVYKYAQKVIEELGITKPPVPTDLLLKYHGLDVKEISYVDCPDIAHETINEKMPYSALNWDKKRIYIYKNLSAFQKRTSIFYECAHYHIPWHYGVNYLSSEEDLPSKIKKRLNREACEYTYELSIPRNFLFNDFDSDISFSKIAQIKSKYRTSFELSAFRFCSLNPLKCCFAVLDVMNFDKSMEFKSNHDFSITVRNIAQSKDFPYKIRTGFHFENQTNISQCCLDSLINNCNIKNQFTLTSHRSSERIEAIIEFKPAYDKSIVCMLVWIPESDRN